jgi:hypothetical protein
VQGPRALEQPVKPTLFRIAAYEHACTISHLSADNQRSFAGFTEEPAAPGTGSCR